MQSGTDRNKFPSDQDQKVQFSRHQFLTLLTFAGWTAALSGCKLVGSQPPSLLVSPNEFMGYSIFNQTMVDMPWPAIEMAAQEGAIVLLPVAVIEEHGPHMGLGADVYQTYLWSKLTRQALESRGIKTLIAPPYYWGICSDTHTFPGSFTVRPETMKAVFRDIHESLLRWGFKYVFSMNLHGDPQHNNVLFQAIRETREEVGIGAYAADIVAPLAPTYPDTLSLEPGTDRHAGAYETALMVAEFPMDVNIELAKTLTPQVGFLPGGYFGDPARFDSLDPEAIRKWFVDYSVATADGIEAFLKRQQ